MPNTLTYPVYHQTDLAARRILVTGGAGFIGSNLVRYLLRNGVGLVRVLDNLATGNLDNIKEFIGRPDFDFIEGDIRNPEDCVKAVEGMTDVLHQAALGSVPRSINDPLTSNAVNIGGFLNMLVAVKDAGISKMVYAASSSTYGDSPHLPKTEDRIGKPLSPYAVTKYVNELYADVFHKVYGVNTIGLRYFNVFGPWQNPNGAYAAVIPKFIGLVLQNEAPLINGDGEQSRDFTFVENAIQANICAMEATSPEALNQVYNIAYGERTTLNGMWEILAQLSGTSLKPTYGPSRAGDVRDSLADISKARTLLGYNPLFDLKTGLESTYQWFLEIESETK